jgi:hypothetical protein
MLHPFPGVIVESGATLFLVLHHRLKTKFYGLIKIVPDRIKKKQSKFHPNLKFGKNPLCIYFEQSDRTKTDTTLNEGIRGL